MLHTCNCPLSSGLASWASPITRLDDFVHQTTLWSSPSVSRAINEAHNHLAKRDFIILIYSQYTNNTADKMHLAAAADDLDLMTQYIRSAITSAHSRVYVLTDFPVSERESWFEYKTFDDNNAGREILATTKDASRNHVSGVIFYGGHAERDSQGSCLVPRPGNRIYGKDVAPLLPRQFKSTVLFVLDACYLDSFFDASVVACFLAVVDGVATRSEGQGFQTGGQVIVVSATRWNQIARTIRLDPANCSHGALLGCLLYHLRGHRASGINPLKLVESLQTRRPESTTQEPSSAAQEPFIASRHPLSSQDFRSLPLFH